MSIGYPPGAGHPPGTPLRESETTTATPIMEVQGLTKHFPVSQSVLPWQHTHQLHAVDDVSFNLYPGKVTALVGESGSGKSTVARLLARLYPATSGTIRFRGEDIVGRNSRKDMLHYRGDVQMIFQDPFGSLNPVKRVEHHLARPLLIHKVVPKDKVRDRVRELLTTVGLVPPDDFAKKFPHQLSGGQRQRVSIARALAVEPDVLLADEPISMLDVSIRMGILNLMLELKEQRRIAFLYITHDIASARYVADEVMVMYAGQVVERGETDAVLQHPLHPYTQLLLSAIPNPEKGLSRVRQRGRADVQMVIDPGPGCRFAPRCTQCQEAFTKSMPRLVEVEPNHWVRCFLYPQS